jgi:hypothetical protein|tara:strand:- start:1703 stop:1945 length:243 start_codon:yes stop_codon:yes gene_type:complete
MENIYEQFFFLKYAGSWSFSEAYNLPVGLRKWFLNRLLKQLEMEKEAAEEAQRGGSKSQTLSAHNQPSIPAQYRNRKTGQ